MRVTEARPDFFTIGGALRPTDESYVERSADRELLDAIRHRQYCYVLTPRQMGKSSLMARTAKRLKEIGMRYVIIDLTSIGVSGLSADSWYLGQVKRINDQLGLKKLTFPPTSQTPFDYVKWWEEHRHLGAVQRFVDFLSSVALELVAESFTVFVDEIDTTLNLPGYSDDYFGAIRSLYNQRATDEKLDRLTFVLLGVASPSDLIRDTQRTPFNIGKRIQLSDFTLEEGSNLLAGLAPDPKLGEELLRDVFDWTDGHPYLTQKACAEVARWASSEWNPPEVPHIVGKLTYQLFFSDAGRQSDDNLEFVRRRVRETDDSRRVLELYARIRSGAVVHDNELDPLMVTMKLSGIVKRTGSGTLQVRNSIYERVFDKNWIETEIRESGKRVQGRVLDVLLKTEGPEEVQLGPPVYREVETLGYRTNYPLSLRVMAISPKGETLATGGFDGAVRLWDLHARSLCATLRSRLFMLAGHEGLVTSISFSPDGQYLAAGILSGAIHLWNLQTRRELADEYSALDGQVKHASAVNSVAFSPDGSMFVSGGADSVLKVWDMAALTQGRAVVHKQGQWQGEIQDLVYAWNGSWIVTAHSDGKLRAHEATTLAPIRDHVARCKTKPASLAASAEGKLVACGTAKGGLQLFDSESFRELARFEGHRKPVSSIVFFPNGQEIGSVATENRLFFWDLRKELQRMRLQEVGSAKATILGADDERFVSLAIFSEGTGIACGLTDGRIRLWERTRSATPAGQS